MIAVSAARLGASSFKGVYGDRLLGGPRLACLVQVTPDDLKRRTAHLAVLVAPLIERLPPTFLGRHIGDQLGRACTSVGAQYRAACRAPSRAAFLHKLAQVEEEGDETVYWLEQSIRLGLLDEAMVRPALTEASEIVSVMVASIKTARRRR